MSKRACTVFVFSHDSVGVGEDGPTHQPVEQVASLRVTPNMITMGSLVPAAGAEADWWVSGTELSATGSRFVVHGPGGKVGLHLLVAMDARSVPQHEQLARKKAQELTQEGDDVRVVRRLPVARALGARERARRVAQRFGVVRHAVVDIDLLGTFHTLRAAYEHLVKPGGSVLAGRAPHGAPPSE